ncbi:uncharacterized protein [Dysidea avara]|uniref:uncharacterized protein isoform X2 n=1 Tax=Dysidea avara TaxID=196820 RepID=UPI003316B24B
MQEVFPIVMICWIVLSSGESCIDNPDVNQKGNNTIGKGKQTIIPSFMFNCSGRITSIAASMAFKNASGDLPIIQIWHPTSLNSNVYNKIGQVQFINTTRVARNHHFTNIAISNSIELEFRSGDVIGYYQSFNSSHLIWNIWAIGYTSYVTNTTNASTTTIDVSELKRRNQQQPLIEIKFDIQCQIPSNGKTTSCSSGRVGVGYEGDTCSFTCNTGYELTGSDTRTCQSDGNWSGSDDVCRRVLLRWSWKKNHSNNKSDHVVLMQNPAYGTATERDYSGHHYELVECRFDDRDSVEINPNPSYRSTRRQPQRKVDSATVKSSGVLVAQNPRCNNPIEMTSSENQYDYVIEDKVNSSQVQSNHDIESSYLSVIAD